MVTKTVGLGMDYTSWGAAVTWLGTQSPLADDHMFVQQADSNEVYTGAAVPVDLNGYDVVMCNVTPHNGDPTVGLKATSNTAGAQAIRMDLTGPGSVEIYDLHFAFNVNAGSPRCIALSTTNDAEIFIHDIIATNTTNATGEAIRVTPVGGVSAGIAVHLYRCETYTWYDGILFDMLYDNDNVLEACTAGGSALGNGITVAAQAAEGSGLVQNCLADTFAGVNRTRITGKNNASVDTSAGDGNWLNGSGNEVSVTLLNEVESVTVGNAAFLQAKAGGVCDDGGLTPSLAGDNVGIRQTPRPHYKTGVGYVTTIGADELVGDPILGAAGGSGSGISSAIVAAINAGYR